MLYPAVNELEKVTNSRYALVILTAKRARQISEINEANDVSQNIKPVKQAILDIADGKVRCKQVNED